MTAALVIVVEREIKSCNDWMYRHWRAYTKERDAWLLTLRVQLLPRQPPTCPVRASILSLRERELDFGNFVAGCKPIPDCLKRLGYIKDDAPRWFVCSYEQRVVPESQRGTRVTLSEAA